MPSTQQPNLTPEQKKRIEQKLINIFKDIFFNSMSVLSAKSESDQISEEIREFILEYSESNSDFDEVDLLMKAKEKGLELVEGHDLVFFDEPLDKVLTMRAFLIPGMKIEFTDENAGEKVTEDDLQNIDHELCVSFKSNISNEFTKLGNLLDIRTKLAKALSHKSLSDKEIASLIKQNELFKTSLQDVLVSAAKVARSKN